MGVVGVLIERLAEVTSLLASFENPEFAPSHSEESMR